jgi:hypothetical protein
MAVTPVTAITQVITALPTAPARTMTPAVFIPTADTFVAALPNFGVQENTLATQINVIAAQTQANATEAFNDAAAALVSANNSAASAITSASTAGAIAWVSGTSYTAGNVVFSTVNFQTYRRSISGAGTTDPSADPTNWTRLTAFQPWATKTTTYTAVSGDRIKANTSTVGAFNITFPAAPLDGDQIEILDIKSNFATANCSILGNGKSAMGFSPLALNVKNLHVVFTYDATLGDWRI